MTTSVDVQGMQAAQEDFQLALDQMNSVYSAMTEEQDNLAANWSGMAASAFGQALGAWLDDLWQIRQELVVMTESLSAHTGIYSDANEASQEVVAAFHQGLDGLETLPVEPGYTPKLHGERMEGRLAARRAMVVRGRTLPAGEAELDPMLQGTPALRQPVFLKSEKPQEPFLPTLNELAQHPVLPRLGEVPEQPLLPTLNELAQHPVLPRLDEVPEQPLLPTLTELPEHPLLPTLETRAEAPLLPAMTGLHLPDSVVTRRQEDVLGLPES